MELLPIGIGIGVQTFSFIINKAIGQCSDFAANYLDDIIAFSRTVEDHIDHLERVFTTLQRADLKIKASKCEYFQKPCVLFRNFNWRIRDQMRQIKSQGY